MKKLIVIAVFSLFFASFFTLEAKRDMKCSAIKLKNIKRAIGQVKKMEQAKDHTWALGMLEKSVLPFGLRCENREAVCYMIGSSVSCVKK